VQVVEISQVKILETPVACVTYQSAFEIIQTLAREPRPTAVCPANTHILAEARDDPNFKRGTGKEIRPQGLKKLRG
jgi:N-acetylglucosaminyldiphosphoundecaprenol N-acetyl-beta-D-mannosaminyltransferase